MTSARPAVIVLGGFAGTGKTTLARRLLREWRLPRLSSDTIGRTIRATNANGRLLKPGTLYHGPMKWTQAFVALLLRFAARVAEVEGVSMDEALLTFTPLYLNFGLTRSFSPQDPTWQEFLAGYHDASQPVAWTHSFYLAHAREYGESPFGCFSYAYESETRTIRLHFGNRDASGTGPLSEERQQVRRTELMALFTDVRREVPAAEAVRGRSWLYNLAAYRRLFPPAYVRTAVPIAPEWQFMSLWGQFLDRHGGVRPGPTTTFLDRIATATTLDTLMRSFPLPVRAPRCPIEHFYAFYGLH